MKTYPLTNNTSRRLSPRQSWAHRGALVMALLLFAGLFTPTHAASPPAYLSYQGYLTTSDGTSPLASGTYDVVFRIYKGSSTSATRLWTEQQAVTVSDGAFSVLLGEGTAVSTEANSYASFAELFSPQRESSDRYVGIEVAGLGGEITPRLQLVTVPYAFTAETAAQLQDGSVVYDSAGTKVTVAAAFSVVGGAATMDSGLAVTGTQDTTAGGVLQVKVGDAKMILDNDEIQSKDANDNVAALYLNGDGGGVTIGKSTSANTIRGNTTLAEAATLSSSLTVEGATTLKGSATINGEATLDSKLTVAGNLGVGTTSPVSKMHLYDSGTPILLLQSGATSGRAWGIESGSDGKLDFTDFTAVKNRLTIDTSGFVYVPQRLGIGTTDLDATTPLIVSSVEHADFNDSGRIDGNGNSSNGNLIKDAQLSIWANGGIRTPIVYLSSDARIKSVIGRTPEAAALETINKLRVTDYRMRDSVVQGTSPRRGFIAQEVEAILPTAVTQRKGIVPDVYQSSESVRFQERERTLSVAVKKPHGLSKGDWVRLIHDRKAETFEIVSIPGDTQFVVAGWETPVEKVFVYGRQVEDLRSVNYEQIFATGIAAIQEVNRKLDASNKRLQSEVATVRGENARLNELVASMMQRLESLELRVQ